MAAGAESDEVVVLIRMTGARGPVGSADEVMNMQPFDVGSGHAAIDTSPPIASPDPLASDEPFVGGIGARYASPVRMIRPRRGMLTAKAVATRHGTEQARTTVSKGDPTLTTGPLRAASAVLAVGEIATL